MNLLFLKNPFFLYPISFFTVILFYCLGWSEIFPDFTFNVILFFTATAITSIIIGIWFNKKKPIQYFTVTSKKSRHVLIAIYICYGISFIYNKGIPLVLILSKSGFYYKNYGIPFFQPLITTFTAFYTVYLFHLYLSKKSKHDLINLLLLLLIPLLIYNRGMLIISLVNFIIIIFISKNKIQPKTWVSIAVLSVVVFYFFGVLGNYRTSNLSNQKFLNDIGVATKKFKEGPVPDELFWAYIYAASPLANFQETVNKSDKTNNQWQAFIVYELLPDFISKRVSKYFKIKNEIPNRISTNLTAGTVYSNSYKYLGWKGPILMFAYLMVFVGVFWCLIKKSNPFYITGISVLGTFVIFNIFSNMISFSGLSLQLAYPLLFQFLIKRITPIININ